MADNTGLKKALDEMRLALIEEANSLCSQHDEISKQQEALDSAIDKKRADISALESAIRKL